MDVSTDKPNPHYAVIFTSLRSNVDGRHSETPERMLEPAAEQPGFLSFESARGTSTSRFRTDLPSSRRELDRDRAPELMIVG